MFDIYSEFHFIRPAWLLLLFALPLVVFLQIRVAKRANSWFNVISPRLFDALVATDSTRKRRIGFLLPSLVLTLAALALSGPTYERLPQPVESRVDSLVIVLDLTLSMQSQDIAPSRVERAKFKIADILERRDEGLTSLVVYAGDAYVVTPLTTDDSTIANLLPSLNPEMMPVKGSNSVAAITRANELLNSIATEDGGILLLTDGIQDFSAVLREVDPKYPISVLGVGSTLRAADSPNTSPLNEDQLADLARIANGRFHMVTANDDDIDHLLSTSIIPDTQILDDQRFDLWHDVGFYLIFPIALLLAWSMRRGGLVVVLVFVGIHIEAGWLEDLWIPRDKQAHAQLESGDFQSAAELFDDPVWEGVAEYRQGNFDAADAAFSLEESTQSLYNKANAMAWQGKFSDAIQTYDSILAEDPEHEDAAHNKAVLEELLKQMANESQSQQNQDQQDQDEQSSQNQQSQQQQASESNEQQEQSESESQQNQEQNQDTEDGENEQKQQSQQDEDVEEQETEENQIASKEEETAEERELREIHERWLRRIPEDPGGLLRRKFASESNARIERGELDQRKTGSAW